MNDTQIYKPEITLINLMRGHSTFWYLRYYYELYYSSCYIKRDLLEDESPFIKVASFLIILVLMIFVYSSLRCFYESYRFFCKPTLDSNTVIKIKNKRLTIETSTDSKYY